MTYCVDRIEEEIAVLERDDKTFFHVPTSDFASDIREGDIVFLRTDGKYEKDKEKTAARKAALYNLQKNIFTD